MHSFVFPGNLDPSIASMGSAPIPYMRTGFFSDINKESEKILLKLVHCTDGRTIIYTGSGTGAMSAVVENYVSTRGKALVIDGGSFGHRWYQLCEYYGVNSVVFKVPFAKDIDYELLERTIQTERPDTLLCQHHETSSGALFDIQTIARICNKFNVSLVVDIISSFLVEPFNMDELGVDICLTSSQKGLNIPPGLSIVFINKRLLDYPFNKKGYYWDFQENLSNLLRGQTPFSPATTLYLQLNARVKQLEAQGGEEANMAAVRHHAQVFRSFCAKYNWPILAEKPSFAITGFQTADENRSIFNGLIEKFDTYIMPGSVPGFYRVSHMGLQTDSELSELAEHIHMLEQR